ncbi:MAG: hypothetical protein J6A89_07090 [Clostridia bacterium]|nr:hypothetical protein [Clostridia bacterium]
MKENQNINNDFEEENSGKVRRKIKLRSLFSSIFESMSTPEVDEEIEEIENEDSNKFDKYLYNLQVKTGSIKKASGKPKKDTDKKKIDKNKK